MMEATRMDNGMSGYNNIMCFQLCYLSSSVGRSLGYRAECCGFKVHLFFSEKWFGGLCCFLFGKCKVNMHL